MRIRNAPDAADRAPFQPMGGDKQVTPESVALDPRADSDDIPPSDAESEEVEKSDVQVSP